MTKLSERERECFLSVAKNSFGEMGYGVYFRTIAAETGLRPDQVRRSVRSCARKGLLVLVRGLFDDEGLVAGSGYGLTPAGVSFAKATGGSNEGRD